MAMWPACRNRRRTLLFVGAILCGGKQTLHSIGEADRGAGGWRHPVQNWGRLPESMLSKVLGSQWAAAAQVRGEWRETAPLWVHFWDGTLAPEDAEPMPRATDGATPGVRPVSAHACYSAMQTAAALQWNPRDPNRRRLERGHDYGGTRRLATEARQRSRLARRTARSRTRQRDEGEHLREHV